MGQRGRALGQALMLIVAVVIWTGFLAGGTWLVVETVRQVADWVRAE